ncbi:MAG: hypothetical protein RBT11_14060 [Desulfobacterales bacterium]|jgi:hypothetical protein|nr:hypothetical protein [Desulfobacterales bacterium]
MVIRYSQAELNRLVSCAKEIVKPPKKEMVVVNGSYRNEMKLKSKDEDDDFTVFFRKNEDFDDNFSVGLRYHPKSGGDSFVVFRCNSKHPHSEIDHFHGRTHFHIAKAENFDKGLKPEASAIPTTEYVTYGEAVLFFCRKCNIINANEWFPHHSQLPLVFKNE